MKRIAQMPLAIAFAALVLLAVSVPLFAHHGTAAFDTSKMLTITGVVKEFQFVNPHAQIYFEVKNDKGNPEPWQGELTAPTKLERAGWTKNTLKPGDTITATGNILKSGAHTMWIRKLTAPSGDLQLMEE